MIEEGLTQEIHGLIADAAPERKEELENLWIKYSPNFVHASDKPGFEMGGGAFGLIPFTPRTMGQIWLLGFAAWRSFEAYCPYILLCNEIAPSAMSDVPDQAEADKALQDELQNVETLRTIESIETFAWPRNIPKTSATAATVRDRAIIDLIKLASAYVFLHETRHVMFAAEETRPTAWEEERECDTFARKFLLEKIADYCEITNYGRESVSNKRLMGIALGAFILLEITPQENWTGTDDHPPIAARLRELVKGTDTHADINAWVYACCLLLNRLRSVGKLPETLLFSDPQDLFQKLVGLLEPSAP